MAANLGVSRKTLSKIINERGAITPDMALRLSRAFDTTPDLWLNLQKSYDLWQAETESQEWKKVKPFPPQMLHHNSSLNSEQSA
jgi:plasmid maintenance system antidote protein VapI